MTSPPTTAPASTPEAAATGSAGPTAFSPAANLLRGALIAYLIPRLAQTSRPHGIAMINAAVKGLTSRNYPARRQQLVDMLTRLTQGRLGPVGIDDLPAMLKALGPEIERADRSTLTVIYNDESNQRRA